LAGFFFMLMSAVAFVLRMPLGPRARGGFGKTAVVSVAWVAIGLFALVIGGTALMCVGRGFCSRGADIDAWMLPFILLPIVVPAALVVAVSAIGRRLG
jgi:hypothetical protein